MHATDNITIQIKQCVWTPVVLLDCHSGLQLSAVSLLNLLWPTMLVTSTWVLTYIHLKNLDVDVGIILKCILQNMPYVTICNMLNFYNEELSSPAQSPSRRTTSCWLALTAYSYPSLLEAISSICTLRTCHATVTKDLPDTNIKYYLKHTTDHSPASTG